MSWLYVNVPGSDGSLTASCRWCPNQGSSARGGNPSFLTKEISAEDIEQEMELPLLIQTDSMRTGGAYPQWIIWDWTANFLFQRMPRNGFWVAAPFFGWIATGNEWYLSWDASLKLNKYISSVLPDPSNCMMDLAEEINAVIDLLMAWDILNWWIFLKESALYWERTKDDVGMRNASPISQATGG